MDEARNNWSASPASHSEEAKRSLIDQMADEARHEAAKRIRVIEEEAREESDRKAKKIVSIAIERLAGEFVAERTVSVVASAQRRDEGPDHRPRGAQHPRHRGRHRRRYHRR